MGRKKTIKRLEDRMTSVRKENRSGYIERIKKGHYVAGEIAQQLGVPLILADGPYSGPSIHMAAHKCL